MAQQIALIIGAGKNIGASTASHFLTKGYKVAQASRSSREEGNTDNSIFLTIDATKPATITSAFEQVRKAWGEPNVVVYNVAAVSFAQKENPLSQPLEAFQADLTVNTLSLYVAAQEAVKSFGKLPASVKKTFLYTGNLLHTGHVWPELVSLGASKSASSYLIRTLSHAFAEKQYGFYFVDERTTEGGPKANPYVDGPAHAEFFAGLADGSITAPWNATFVRDKGYVDFTNLIKF